MATIDTLQDAVNTLTSSTTELLDEVQTNKSTLTDSATSASNSATNAASSASSASSSASSASSSATAAASSASDAASSAASANAVVQGTAAVRHSVRPSLLLDFANSKTLDPRITFSRSSAGTYYDGKATVKAEENLINNSGEPITSYDSSVTRTLNATTAPDGTSTATKLASDGTSGTHYAYAATNSLASGTKTFSIYLKAGTLSYVQVFFQGTGSPFNVDLSTGSVQAVSTATLLSSVGIVDVGNGWYRVHGVTTSSGSHIWMLPVNNLTSSYYESNTLSGDFYVWGPQVEGRDSVTAYTPTSGQPITNYIPVLQTAAANTARFDHDPLTGESKGLLIEESRTNLLTKSEDFTDGAVWVPINTNISTANQAQIVAPDGTLSARIFRVNTNAAGATRLQSAYTFVSGNTYTLSMYLKYGGQRYATLCLYRNTSNSYGAGFDLVDNEVTAIGGNGTNYSASNAKMEHVGNGWYRCSVDVTVGDTAASDFILYLRNDEYTTGTGTHYAQATGDGYKGVYVWGAQLETGSFPTSYIATSGAQATRSHDAASMTGTNFSDWYRQSEGTIYSEASQDSSDYFLPFVISDGTVNNRIEPHYGSAYHLLVTVNGTNTANLDNGATSKFQYSKSASGYKTDDFAVSLDGNAVTTDLLGTVPSNLTRAYIGAKRDGSVSYSGHIKKIAYYPTRLSNAELQAITED